MDELKKLIQAMVISSAGSGITVTQLNKDFKYHEGYDIPYGQFGFKQLNMMLRSMSDAVQLEGQGPTALVFPVTTAKSNHIRKMILQQKTNGKGRKSNTPRYSTYNSRNNHSPRNSYISANFARRNDIMEDDSFENSSDELDYEAYGGPGSESETKPAEISSHFLTNHEVCQPESSTSNSIKKMNINHDTTNSLKQSENEHAINRAVEKMLIETPEIPLTAMTLTDNLRAHPLPSTIKPGCIFKILIVSVLSPSNIYVHMICNTEILVLIAEQLDRMYNGLESDWHVKEELAKEGLYCVVKYHDVWYRGMISGPVVDRHVTVLLIDYGHQRMVPLSDVKYMRKKDASLPLQNLRVSLAHVKPSERQWTEEATRYLSKATCNKVLHGYLVDSKRQDNILDVVFIDTDNATDVILNSELVSKGHAKWMHLHP